MLEFEINGKKITTRAGATIIEAADEVGIYIPRFCYHKKLTVAANCRMCLVEVAKSGKPLPACATPVTQGMEVFTTSEKALAAQRSVMEYLLINHPLDCPICDQGGECELQDLSMGFGFDHSCYDQSKRAVFNKDLGPLIDPEMTRCIQCTRCVRFGEEVAGLKELGVINRGDREEIGTYVQHFLTSEMSGNIIDLCPVGALNNKPARYKGRGFEYQEHPGIAPHDGVGSNLFIHVRGKEYFDTKDIMRIVPRENEAINETWLSDRDRFSMEGLKDSSRILKPLAKKEDGTWIEISWETALEKATHAIQKVLQEKGPDQFAILTGHNNTTEEYYLLSQLCRGLGSENIDYRIRYQDVSVQEKARVYGFETKIADIENLEAILLVDANVRESQPIIHHRLRKANKKGAEIFSLACMDYELLLNCKTSLVTPNTLLHMLAQIANAVTNDANIPYKNISVQEEAKHIALALSAKNKKAIFIGEQALQHENSADVMVLINYIASKTQASINVLTPGANSQGAYITQAFSQNVLKDKTLDTYLLFNIEPEFDAIFANETLAALHKAHSVIAFSSFLTDSLQSYADLILPIATFTENTGTFINVEGRWQTFTAASKPAPDIVLGWKALCDLGSALGLKNFAFLDVLEITKILEQEGATIHKNVLASFVLPEIILEDTQDLMRVGGWPIYRGDALVRRSKPLQMVQKNLGNIFMHENDAHRLNLQNGDRVRVLQNDGEVILPVIIGDKVPVGVMCIYAGLEETKGFGIASGPIQLVRC